MNSTDMDISTTGEWRAVEALAASTGETTLRELFDRDPHRGSHLGLTAGELYIDLSKNLVTEEVVRGLLGLARVADLPGRREAMFRGDRINTTEDRPSSTRLSGEAPTTRWPRTVAT